MTTSWQELIETHSSLTKLSASKIQQTVDRLQTDQTFRDHLDLYRSVADRLLASVKESNSACPSLRRCGIPTNADRVDQNFNRDRLSSTPNRVRSLGLRLLSRLPSSILHTTPEREQGTWMVRSFKINTRKTLPCHRQSLIYFRS